MRCGSRRAFLRTGATGLLGSCGTWPCFSGLGFSWPLFASPSVAFAERAAAPAATPAEAKGTFGRAKHCILLFLTGGPPQHDTFDPKPLAPAEIRGEFRPIATRLPGVQFGELFPGLAQRADRLCLVRSLTHGDRVHTSAGYTMLTGAYHPLANSDGGAGNVRPNPNDRPHLGSVLSLVRGHDGMPPFVSLPEVIKDAAVNEFPGQDAGFLHKRFGPLRVDGSAATARIEPPGLGLPEEIPLERLLARRSLLSVVDRNASGPAVDAHANMQFEYDRAFELVRAPRLRQAFELERENASVREKYGRHLFGQGCLLARRLVEADIAFVTVYWHYEGPDDSPVWDTHWNNFQHLRERLASPTDRAVSALLDDLRARGRLDDTLVVCLGEFGRTPKINNKAGRDHWPHAQSILLAGAGIRAGQVVGASDATGAHPADAALTPPDLAATILHLLGVPRDLMVFDRLGRPLHACEGRPVRALLA